MDTAKELALYGKALHDKGLVIGAGGNISSKQEDILTIKKQGYDMSLGEEKGYISISFDEYSENSAEPSTETPFHIACYEARKEISAVVHVHSPYTVAAAAMGQELSDISYEFDCIIQKPVPVIDFIKPGSAELASEIKEKIASGANAVLMYKHGAVSVGKDVKEAYLRMLALDRACIAFLLSKKTIS